MTRTTIVLDKVIRDKAHGLGLNVSEIARNAVRSEVLRRRPRPSIRGFVAHV